MLSDSAFSDTSNTSISEYSMNYEYYQLTRGHKYYELTSHLGNVMVVINDKRLMICSGDISTAGADLQSARHFFTKRAVFHLIN